MFCGYNSYTAEISFYSKFNLLRLGFKVKNDYIDISVDEKINFDLSTDKGLFEFLIFGNKEYKNNDKIGEFSSLTPQNNKRTVQNKKHTGENRFWNQ